MTDACSGDSFDSIVIGGGVVGLSASWFLAREGNSVLCLDHGYDAGSTANAGSLHVQMQSRLERLFPGRVAEYEKLLPLYPLAVDTWAEVARELGEDIGFRLGGGLMVAETPEDLASLEAKSARENANGVETRILGREELRSVADYLDDGLVGASFCPKEGKVDPLLANDALKRAAIGAGVVMHEGSRAERLEPVGGAIRVHTARGRFEGGRVVVAAGAGSTAVAASVGINLPVVAEPLHMNITEAAEPFMPHLVQHASRPITMKQLGRGHLVIGGGWPAEPGAAPRAPVVVAASLTGNLALAARLVPGIEHFRVIRTWAGVNPTADLLSILGNTPGVPQVYVLVPGDAGYTLGPCLARMLCEHLAGRDPGFPLQAFSPARFPRSRS